MNLIVLLDEDLRPDGTARLTGRRARHIREVHRARPGQSLAVGRLSGFLGRGTVLASSPDEVVLAVELRDPPPARPGVSLILAMPRPKMLRRLLAAVASLGVDRLALLGSQRVEKSYFDSPVLRPGTLREHLLLGLEQGRDTHLPEVRVRTRFWPFVKDELESFCADAQRLLAHPGAAQTLEQVAGGCGSPAVLAVGPEGGFVPDEVSALEARGFVPFSLGPRILRVDTAVPFALGQLELARRAGPWTLVPRPESPVPGGCVS